MTDLVGVHTSGYELQYVKEQTPEICLAAVQQDGRALRYVDAKLKDEVCAAMN